MSLRFGTLADSPSEGFGSPHDPAVGDVCIANIGPRERRRRLTVGIVAFVFGLALAGLLILTGVHPLWQIVLFLPFAMAASGYFQARDKT